MIPNDRIKDLIAQKYSATVVREEAVKAGMKPLREAGVEKIVQGISSVSEVLRVTEKM